MRKIRLSLDSLRVDSFSTGSAEAGGGTVHARQAGTIQPTAHFSCNYSGFDTCVVECECTNAHMRCKNPFFTEP